MDYNRLVAANVRRQRIKCGLTQERLAQEAGISPQHLSKIERCACSPTVGTLVRLAERLEVSPAVFFDRTDVDSFMYLYTDVL